MSIPLVSSTAANAEGSQIIGTINGVIQSINSQTLQVATSPTSLRNIVIGGDFNTNLWQRGTTFTAITNATTYTADRFYAIGGASSSISVSKQTASVPLGFGAKLRFGRAAANADLTAITLNYIVASEDVFQMQGLPFVLSFYAQAGANFSAAANTLGITVTTGTTADEGNSAYNAGTWTGTAAVSLIGSTGTAATGVTLTGTWARYAVAGVIPAAALEVGFTLKYTPVGTAGASDFFEVAGVQLEVAPQGGVQPTPFERRPLQLERQLQQRYTQVISDAVSASSQQVIAQGGMASSTTVATIALPIAVPFRAVPVTTYPTGAVGGLVFRNPLNTLSSTLVLTQALTSTAISVTAQGTSTTPVLGAAAPVALVTVGGGGTGITMSAEL